MRVLKGVTDSEVVFSDQNLLKAALDAADAPLAGKHMPWEDFCNEFSDLVEPFRAKYPQEFALADAFVSRLKTYGKHAAGVVISTEDPLTDLPMRMGSDGVLVTQFDMEALEALGYVKFDLLTLRTLDTIQMAVDLIKERTGSTSTSTPGARPSTATPRSGTRSAAATPWASSRSRPRRAPG